MDLWVSKLLAAIIIFITVAIAGLAPIKLYPWFNSKGEVGLLWIGVFTCFGGGVFLGLYLMHMTPEVIANLDRLLLMPNNITYPLAELTIAAGFFLMVYMDKTVAYIALRTGRKRTRAKSSISSISSISNISSKSNEKAGQQNGAIDIESEGGTDQRSIYKGRTEDNVLATRMSVCEPDLPRENDVGGEFGASSPLILLIAMTIECVFSGIIVALEDDPFGVLSYVIAVLSHEWVMAFCISLELIKFFSTRYVTCFAVFYATTVPMGILIGIPLYNLSSDNTTLEIVNVFIVAICAGIFLYVTFLEMLRKEMIHNVDIYRILALTAGFLFMAAVLILENISNGTEDEEIGTTTSATNWTTV